MCMCVCVCVCVCVCERERERERDPESSAMRRPRSELDCCVTKRKIRVSVFMLRITSYFQITVATRGTGSSVGVVTDDGMDGPRIESRWGRDFPHLSRPTLWPTQPPVQWVQGLSRG